MNKSFRPFAVFVAQTTGKITRVSISNAPIIFIATEIISAVTKSITKLWIFTLIPMEVAISQSKKIIEIWRKNTIM